ncbi:hypothetical protein MLD63_14030 [Paracoccus sp. TK19116]|uniref:ATP-binding protein n=1 Tax=Paracoccus albicereus TaxID=2922394 RepID=A0ABT1MTA1_9RHOB|nr:hypothetical protein [Paracoccus albicereus]MCQ0971540.1 hypothetical protein [Paracoccus albicereus]
MKKLSQRQKRLLIKRAVNGNRKHILRLYSSRPTVEGSTSIILLNGEFHRVKVRGVARHPPSSLDFEDNYHSTLSYLESLRKNFAVRKNSKMGWVFRESWPGGGLYIRDYTDYSKIEGISTSAALVLTAEYDRARELINSTPPAIDLHKWNKRVFTALFELGFFELLGLSEDVGIKYSTSGDLRTMRIVSGSSTEELAQASNQIMELSKFIYGEVGLPSKYLKEVTTAICEGLSNVTGWAYPSNYRFKYLPVGRWWVTASAHRVNRTLTIALYDQGASIPVTFAAKPTKSLPVRLLSFLQNALNSTEAEEYANDAAYIEGALRFGASSTGLDNRGQGLPQMRELIDFVGGGSISVLSRAGRCSYEHGGGVVRESCGTSVGGTLVEWRLALPAIAEDG